MCPEDPSKSLINKIIDDICECFDQRPGDDQVYLQMIKALLTVIASNTVEVHGESLILIFRTCFNIHLVGKETIV